MTDYFKDIYPKATKFACRVCKHFPVIHSLKKEMKPYYLVKTAVIIMCIIFHGCIASKSTVVFNHIRFPVT